MFARDILECVQALYGDPQHAQYLCFAPERHYADAEKAERLYHDINSGMWWWSTQVRIPHNYICVYNLMHVNEIKEALERDKPGATIIPIILSSDKTQLTLFRNKSAYPVYLTIDNLLKSIRRKPSHQGQILLAYLPVTRLENIKNKAASCRTLANLFHACMSRLTQPLQKAGISGVIMMSGDGVKCRCHPIFAAHVADYPEQCLVTGAYNGDCPGCDCPHHELEMFPCQYNFRDLDSVLDAFEQLGSVGFDEVCRNVNIKPLQHPFWKDLPYVDIFQSITPYILHQLYQGVFKHLVSWLTTICGATEIDARVRRLPPNHHICLFYKGISSLSRVTGTEHKQMGAFIVGVIMDTQLPGNASSEKLVRATRALLDFIFSPISSP